MDTTFSKVTPERTRQVIPVGNILPAFSSYEVTVSIPQGHDEGSIHVAGGERHVYRLPAADAYKALQVLNS